MNSNNPATLEINNKDDAIMVDKSVGVMGSRSWLIAVTVALAAFMEVLDTSIANVALQNIAGGLSAGQDEANWVLTAYLVANAVVLPVSGWLATLVGRKRFFVICLATFTLSSFMCGMAWSINSLILFRILQGASGAGMLPTAQAILADAFPAEKRGAAFAVYGIAVVFAPAIGPTLGGWLTDTLSWHWVFLINVPVGILAVAASLRLVSDTPEAIEATRHARNGEVKIDYVGIILLAIGLGSLQMVLEEGNRQDWLDSSFIIFFAITASVTLFFVPFWEMMQTHPVIDLQLFKNRNYVLSNIMMFMIGAVLFLTTALMPLFAQTILGYTATLAGWAMTPGGFTIVLMMPLVAVLIRKVDVRYLLMAGVLLSSFGIYYTTRFTANVDFNTVVWARIFQSSGFAFLFVPVNTAAYVGIPKDKSNDVSVMLNLMRNLGGSVGISLGTTIYARRAQYHQSILVSNVTLYNPNATAALQHITQTLISHGTSAIEATAKAPGVLYGLIIKQAYTLSFNDVCWLLAIAFISTLPLILLMKKNKPGEGSGEMAH